MLQQPRRSLISCTIGSGSAADTCERTPEIPGKAARSFRSREAIQPRDAVVEKIALTRDLPVCVIEERSDWHWAGHAAPRRPTCQIASNCDPFFAPNRDPSGGLIELRGMAFTGVGRLWVSGLPERPFRVRRRQATYPQRTARTLLVRSQFRFLNRQLVLPVSTMSQ